MFSLISLTTREAFSILLISLMKKVNARETLQRGWRTSQRWGRLTRCQPGPRTKSRLTRPLWRCGKKTHFLGQRCKLKCKKKNKGREEIWVQSLMWQEKKKGKIFWQGRWPWSSWGRVPKQRELSFCVKLVRSWLPNLKKNERRALVNVYSFHCYTNIFSQILKVFAAQICSVPHQKNLKSASSIKCSYGFTIWC